MFVSFYEFFQCIPDIMRIRRADIWISAYRITDNDGQYDIIYNGVCRIEGLKYWCPSLFLCTYNFEMNHQYYSPLQANIESIKPGSHVSIYLFSCNVEKLKGFYKYQKKNMLVTCLNFHSNTHKPCKCCIELLHSVYR